MNASLLLLISLFFSSHALLSDTYICNLDYSDDANDYDDFLNSSVTAIFFLDECRAGQQRIFEEEFGPFTVEILCQAAIEIIVKPGHKEIIRTNFKEPRSLSYRHKQAGLHINCQGKDIREAVLDVSPEADTPSYSFRNFFPSY